MYRRLAQRMMTQRMRPQRRSFIALPQGDAAPVIGGIIAANVGTYALWQTQNRNLMVSHFTLCAEDIGRKPHTLVTSFFSHNDGWHLAGNMLTLFFFGPEVIYAVGARAFISLYVGSGCVSGLCQVAPDLAKHSYWKKPRYLGASGAVNAPVVWSILLSPWRLIFVFAEFLPIPLPAILYGGAFVAKDVAALTNTRIPYISDRFSGPNVAHGAHVAGAAAGAIHFFFWRYGGGSRFRRWR